MLGDHGLVRVAGHDHVHAGAWRIQFELRQVVDRVDPDFAELHELAVAQCIGPGTAVVVAAHRGDRRDARELRQYAGIADVAAVHDRVAAAQERQCLRPQQAVRVRDQADAAHGVHGPSTA